MSFFGRFPIAQYENLAFRNFLLRVATDIKHKNKNRFVFDKYTIKDNERADVIADKFYGGAKHHWITYVINNIGPNDWPMNSDEFEEYMEEKYGDTKHLIKHYVDEQGQIVPYVFYRKFTCDGQDVKFYNNGDGFGALADDLLVASSLTPVTHYEWENEQNESRRQIDILQKKFVAQFIADFEEAIGTNVRSL